MLALVSESYRVFYFYFGLRMHKFEVKFIDDCYFIQQFQMAGWIKKVDELKNYIETVQFYPKLSTKGIVHSETYNQKESTIFQQFATLGFV